MDMFYEFKRKLEKRGYRVYSRQSPGGIQVIINKDDRNCEMLFSPPGQMPEGEIMVMIEDIEAKFSI